MDAAAWHPGLPDRRASRGEPSNTDLQIAIASQAEHLASVTERLETLTGAVTTLNHSVSGLVTIYNTGAGLFVFLKITAKVVGYLTVVGAAVAGALHWLRTGAAHA